MPVRLLQGAAALAALAGASSAGRGIVRRRRMFATVAPDLRHPLVLVPLSLRGTRSLRIGRRLIGLAPAGTVSGAVPESRAIPGPGRAVDVFVHRPDGHDDPRGALLWIHGGGLVMGEARQAHETCAALAEEVGVVVVNVEYRLAPEHPFPAALDDCSAALHWLHDQADELGIDPHRIAVGGDSAGGGLAAAVAQRARDEGGPPLALQLLVYPMLDDRTGGRDVPPTLVWTPTSNRFAWRAYLGHGPGEDDHRPHAVPARCADLTGLAPAWIGVGAIDLFHDEDLAYASRLRDAGVPCDLHVPPGMYHGADAVVPTAPTSIDFRRRMAEALRQAVGPSSANGTSDLI